MRRGNDECGCGNDVMRREWVERKGAGTQSHCRRTSPRCSEWVERSGRRDAKVALTGAGVGNARAQGRKDRSVWGGEVGWGWVSGCGGAECGCVVDCWEDGACDRRGDGAGGRIVVVRGVWGAGDFL